MDVEAGFKTVFANFITVVQNHQKQTFANVWSQELNSDQQFAVIGKTIQLAGLADSPLGWVYWKLWPILDWLQPSPSPVQQYWKTLNRGLILAVLIAM